MFARSRAKAVEAFTPPALPGFFAIPTSIPPPAPSVSLPLKVALTYSVAFSHRSQELLWRAWLVPNHYCCSMPSATPGRNEKLVFSALHSVACGLHQSFSLPHVRYFGAHYRIQPLSFTSQPLHNSALLPPALGVEFPSWLFRLPSGFLVTP